MREPNKLNRCIIPAPHSECEEKRKTCEGCPYFGNCDYPDIRTLWAGENEINGDNTLLGAFIPGPVKTNIRDGDIYIYGTTANNFVFYAISSSHRHIAIYDIYIDESARGKGLTRDIINKLFSDVNDEFVGNEQYMYDIFAKCVRGTSAEAFWSHIATREHPAMNKDPNDWYEHRIDKHGNPKRDVAWFRIIDPRKQVKMKQQNIIRNDNTFKKQLW